MFFFEGPVSGFEHNQFGMAYNNKDVSKCLWFFFYFGDEGVVSGVMSII